MADDEQQLEKLEIDRDQLAVCSSCGFSGKLIDVVAHADSCIGAASPPAKRNGSTPKKVANSNAKRDNPETVVSLGRKERGEENFIWPAEAVLLLIELYEQHEELFSSPRYTKKSVWEKISSIMTKRGYHLTGLQVDNKWKFLKRHYKKVKNSDNSSQQSWPFFEAMDQLALKVNLDSLPTDSSEEPSGKTPGSAASNSSSPKFLFSGPFKKKRKLVDIEPAWIKTLRFDMNRREQMAQRRHDEFIQVQKDNQMLFKEMMEKFIGAIKK